MGDGGWKRGVRVGEGGGPQSAVGAAFINQTAGAEPRLAPLN